MIEVELPDGRVVEFPEGTDQSTMRQAISKLMMRDRIAAAKAGTLEMRPGSAEAAAAANEQAMAQMVPEQTFGQGLVQGARDQNLALGLLSALPRGAAETLGAPGTIGDLLNTGAVNLANTLLGTDLKTTREITGQPSPVSGEAIRSALSSATGGATEYRVPGLLGDIVSTTGEFVGGGPSASGRNLALTALSGAASEGAGKATEGVSFLGVPLEPYARMAGAFGTSFLGSKPGAFVGDSETARMANVLREAGVDVTTGQGTGSQALMRMEGRLQATDEQLADFTAATMRQIGSNAKTALPENLAAAQNAIVKKMDDAVSGVRIVPSKPQAQAAARVAKNYVDRVPEGQLTPRIRGISNEIKALSASNKDVTLSRLKDWRTDIGEFTVSPDPATRKAAHALRELIDDMTDQALTAAGRADDIAALAKAREEYRNFIGVRDAASRKGAESGILSPDTLNQSVIRAQGRENYAVGNTTPMTDFTRSAAATLRPAPTVLPGGQRTISQALPAASAAAAASAGYGMGFDPLSLGMAAAGGAFIPAVGQLAVRSAPVQALLRDPMGTIAQTVRTVPGLLAQ